MDLSSHHPAHFIRRLSPQVRGVWQETEEYGTRRLGSVVQARGYWRPIAYSARTPILWVGSRETSIDRAVENLLEEWHYYDTLALDPTSDLDGAPHLNATAEEIENLFVTGAAFFPPTSEEE